MVESVPPLSLEKQRDVANARAQECWQQNEELRHALQYSQTALYACFTGNVHGPDKAREVHEANKKLLAKKS